MSSVFTTTKQRAAISLDERQRRQDAMREGIASARIEGGSVGPGTEAIMQEWAQGLITEDRAIERIKALHLPPQGAVSTAAD